MSTVYQIRNLESGRVYVGATSQLVRKRWADHIHYLKRGRHSCPEFQADWNRLGPSSFAWEPLEEVSDLSTLGGREAAWMAERIAEGVALYNKRPNVVHRGQVLKRNPQRVLALTVDREVIRQIDIAAKAEGQSRSWLVRRLLVWGLKVHEDRRNEMERRGLVGPRF